MNGFALNNIQNAYVGSTPVQAIYLGSTLIWPTTPPHDYSHDYLTFTALENTTFTFTNNALQYSLDDGVTWTTLAANTTSPVVTAGNKILWKQTGLIPATNAGIGRFSATGNFEASGNIMSLYYGDNFIGQTDLTGKNFAFDSIFNGNTNLISSKNLILSATILSIACYVSMFAGCTSLTTPPELHATTLAQECCVGMFYDCRSLTTAPELHATTLARQCYEAMFKYCSSLTTAPELPATALVQSCYQGMFEYCSSLTTAPELPATALAQSCYTTMFSDCTSLTTAPELPATTLATGCYYMMFKGCSSLNNIKCLATDISASNCTLDWVNGVSPSGTFTKDATMSSWTTGNDGIPSGWTLINA